VPAITATEPRMIELVKGWAKQDVVFLAIDANAGELGTPPGDKWQDAYRASRAHQERRGQLPVGCPTTMPRSPTWSPQDHAALLRVRPEGRPALRGALDNDSAATGPSARRTSPTRQRPAAGQGLPRTSPTAPMVERSSVRLPVGKAGVAAGLTRTGRLPALTGSRPEASDSLSQPPARVRLTSRATRHDSATEGLIAGACSACTVRGPVRPLRKQRDRRWAWRSAASPHAAVAGRLAAFGVGRRTGMCPVPAPPVRDRAPAPISLIAAPRVSVSLQRRAPCASKEDRS